MEFHVEKENSQIERQHVDWANAGWIVLAGH